MLFYSDIQPNHTSVKLGIGLSLMMSSKLLHDHNQSDRLRLGPISTENCAFTRNKPTCLKAFRFRVDIDPLQIDEQSMNAFHQKIDERSELRKLETSEIDGCTLTGSIEEVTRFNCTPALIQSFLPGLTNQSQVTPIEADGYLVELNIPKLSAANQ